MESYKSWVPLLGKADASKRRYTLGFSFSLPSKVHSPCRLIWSASISPERLPAGSEPIYPAATRATLMKTVGPFRHVPGRITFKLHGVKRGRELPRVLHNPLERSIIAVNSKFANAFASGFGLSLFLFHAQLSPNQRIYIYIPPRDKFQFCVFGGKERVIGERVRG